MNIAMVSAYWHYPEVAYEFHLPLARAGHNVSAILWNQAVSRITKYKVTNGFTIYEVPGLNLLSIVNSPDKYPFMFDLPQAIVEVKPDVIDCQSHLFLTTFQATKFANSIGLPVIVTVHGTLARKNLPLNMAQRFHVYTFGSYVFKKATLVRCLTESDKREIIKYGCPPEKIRIIPNAVDINRFKPRSIRRENLVVWVGRFVPEKDLDTLVKAIAIVAKRFKDVEVCMVGDGPLKNEIIRLVHVSGLTTHFNFTGSLGLAQVADILGTASIFVLPSLKEGMPNSLLEAMASGLAVVGSDISGIKALVTHDKNGLLVPPKNCHALSKAILELLENPDLRSKMGQNARLYIVKTHSWNTIISDIECIYNEALTSHN